MACMLQVLINAGYRVDPIIISHGWMEFDTNGDYEKVTKWFKEGKIGRYTHL